MVARSPKKISKAHALNKTVRREKARLRARRAKKHELKPTIKHGHRIRIKLKDEVREKFLMYCKENNLKPHKAIKRILRAMMEKDENSLIPIKDIANTIISGDK